MPAYQNASFTSCHQQFYIHTQNISSHITTLSTKFSNSPVLKLDFALANLQSTKILPTPTQPLKYIPQPPKCLSSDQKLLLLKFLVTSKYTCSDSILHQPICSQQKFLVYSHNKALLSKMFHLSPNTLVHKIFIDFKIHTLRFDFALAHLQSTKISCPPSQACH